jgi:hypothetical protein
MFPHTSITHTHTHTHTLTHTPPHTSPHLNFTPPYTSPHLPTPQFHTSPHLLTPQFHTTVLFPLSSDQVNDTALSATTSPPCATLSCEYFATVRNAHVHTLLFPGPCPAQAHGAAFSKRTLAPHAAQALGPKLPLMLVERAEGTEAGTRAVSMHKRTHHMHTRKHTHTDTLGAMSTSRDSCVDHRHV